MHSQIRNLILGGLCLALCAPPALAGQPTAEGSFVSPRLHLFSTVFGGGPYLGCCGYAPTAFKVTKRNLQFAVRVFRLSESESNCSSYSGAKEYAASRL